MSAAHLSAVRPVDLDAIPDYPLDPSLRLDSHSFIQWEHRRWMSSDMRWSGTHECKSMWFELVNLAHGETPVGTLPNDMKRLAKMVQPSVDAEHFESLCALKYGPLHGWVHCRCGDDVRLMHPVVTRIVTAAFASRANHAAKVEAASQKRKLERLAEDVAQLAPSVVDDPRKIRWINNFIEERVAARGGARRNAQELHEAVQACLAEDRNGRFPKDKS